MKITQPLFLALLLLACPAVKAQYQWTTNNGTFSYSRTETNVTITGYSGANDVIIPGEITNLPVTIIGAGAFASQSAVTSVTIPNSVALLEPGAFTFCTSLASVTIPDSVTNLADGGFTVDPSYLSVGYGQGAFTRCTNLGSVNIGAGVTHIGDATFTGCSKLTSVMIPGNVSSIGNGAFAYCDKLTDVTISGGVTSLGDQAFNGAGLTSVTIPASVTSVGNDVFGGNVKLADITVDGGNPDYAGVNGVLFNRDITTLVQCPGALGGTYFIPNTVTSVGAGAFEYCNNLLGVVIPGSVTSIGAGAFLGCSGLTSITIPASVSDLAPGVFGASSVTSVTLPDTMASIGDYAFWGCGLTNIVIPASVTSLGEYAFQYDSSLISVYFMGNAPTVDMTGFDSDSTTTGYYLPCTTGWNGFSAITTLPVAALNFTDFTANPISGQNPLTVNFNSPGVDNCGYAITNWYWVFGDGSTSTAQNPAHTYTIAGYFFPSLTATNNVGSQVLGLGPAVTVALNSGLVQNGGFETGDFTGWTLSGDTDDTFVDNGSSILPPPPDNYVAALGGGSGSMGYLSQNLPTSAGTCYLLSFSVQNQYADPGEFVVSWDGNAILDLAQVDAVNWTGMQFVVQATGANTVLQFGFADDFDEFGLDNISVTAVSNFLQFAAAPTAGPTPLMVQFTGASVDNEGSPITNWVWDFGDGFTSSNQNPTHVYYGTGTFLPNLMAANNLGGAVAGLGPGSITANPTLSYSGLVLNGGFGTGDFTGWILFSNTSYVIVDDGSQTGFTPYAGNYEAAFETSGSLGYLSQTLSTTPGASYLLSFAFENPDEDPGEFLVSWNGNTLLDTTSLAYDNWTNMRFVVSATGTNTVLKFGFQDDNDFLALDAVDVETNFLQYTATPATGPTPLTVNFTSPSVDNAGHPIAQWLWNFGDGSTSVAQNPSHVYTTPGAFTPVLVVTNNIGGTVAGFGPAPIVSSLSAADPLSFAILSTNQTVNNSAFEVAGTAVDYVAVDSVYCQMNGGSWFAAGTVDDWTNWTAGVALIPGTNIIAAYAVDTLGNFSATNTVTLVYAPTSPLVLLTNGPGSVTPNLNGKDLQIGTVYTFRAIPKSGAVFIDWTGGTTGALAVLTNGPTLEIAMAPNLVLQANFEVQPGIVNFSISTAGLVLNGTNGNSGATYYLLASTNLALPLSQWKPVLTNVLGAGGSFTIAATNALNFNTPQTFYILETQ